MYTSQSEYGFIGPILQNEDKPYLRASAVINVNWKEDFSPLCEDKIEDEVVINNLQSQLGQVIQSGEKLICNAVDNVSLEHGFPEGHPNIHSYLALPIYGNAGLIAMFCVANSISGYDDNTINELKPIIELCTAIIEASRNALLIKKKANQDALTGVYNRHYFNTFIKEFVRQNTASKNKFCIMMLDFDLFKQINDFYGHHIGDGVLIEFTKRIKTVIKEQDLVARIGGDEFVLLINSLNRFEDTGQIAERIIKASKDPYYIDNEVIQGSVSNGIACYPGSGKKMESLLKHADLAMYRAKEVKKKYAFFSKTLEEKFILENQLEIKILKAFEQKDFIFYFQPQVDLITGETLGFEALIRWQQEDNSIKKPIEFMAIIESMGKTAELNTYVIEQALPLFANLRLYKTYKISINITPHVNNLYHHF